MSNQINEAHHRDFKHDFKVGLLDFLTGIGVPIDKKTIRALAEKEVISAVTDTQHHTLKGKIAASTEAFVRDIIHTNVD